MGLFDGRPGAADSWPQALGIPVLGVIDASAMAGTFGAPAPGAESPYAPGCRGPACSPTAWRAPAHARMLEEGTPAGQPGAGDGQGAVARTPAMALPERHLGLTMASEIPDALQRLDAAADALEGTPLGATGLAGLQRWSSEFPPVAEPQAPPPCWPAGNTIAVARDAAFCFVAYPATHWRCWRAWARGCASSRPWPMRRCCRRGATRYGCRAATRSCTRRRSGNNTALRDSVRWRTRRRAGPRGRNAAA